MEKLSERSQLSNPFSKYQRNQTHSRLPPMGLFDIILRSTNRGCKLSLPVTEGQWLQQGWKSPPENSQPSAILGEGGGGVVYKQELRLCRSECTKCAPVVCAVKKIYNTLVSQTVARQAREAEVMEAIHNCSVCLQPLVPYSQCSLTFCFG